MLALLSWTVAAVGCGAAAPQLPSGGFTLPLGRSHPLTGKAFSRADGTWLSSTRLYDAVAAADYLVLGETHDNRDHHRLQAELLAVFLDEHPKARVAFEMLDESVAERVARRAYQTPEQFAQQVAWDASGWPEFALYRPIFEVALAHGAVLVAAHPSAEHVRGSMTPLPEPQRRELHLDVALPADQQQAQRDEIREAHCGHAHDAMITSMQRAQSYKDAFMARAVQPAPTVLIAGRGHARTDRGVPFYLHAAGATKVVSVGFTDVDDARTKPSEYEVGAFDYVVFTPRVSDADACEEFRKQLEQMRQHAAPPASDTTQ